MKRFSVNVSLLSDTDIACELNSKILEKLKYADLNLVRVRIVLSTVMLCLGWCMVWIQQINAV